MENLIKAFRNTELNEYCENIDIALGYYEGETSTDEFVEWYTETYIHSAEIIYYHNAMEFLLNHDPSLQESMSLASEYGYSPKDINSELLASLLLQGVLTKELESLRDDIEEYFEELEDENNA